MDQRRRLVLVRHAQAESFAASDLERPLTDEGRQDAAALGQWMSDHGIVPDEAWVSAALRTRETWAALSTAAGWTVEPHIDGHLYGTDDQGVLEIVRVTDDAVRTTVVIGHNPTMEMLAHLLDDGDASAEVGTAYAGFPTATTAVFEIAGEWADAGPMAGRLTHFHVARVRPGEPV